MNQSATFTKTYSLDGINNCRARLPYRIPAIKTPLYFALMGQALNPQGGAKQNKDYSDVTVRLFLFFAVLQKNTARHNIETNIMTENNAQNNRIIREPEMLKLAGHLSRSTLLRWEKVGKFPKRRKLGSWLVGWLESDFQAWLNDGSEK